MKELLAILVAIVDKLGYLGIIGTTGLEYACFPVSSELLLPFIGYTVSQGELQLLGAILASTIGGILGCSFCYGVGRFGGDFIERTLCKKSKGCAIGIARAKRYFQRAGKQSVLWGRIFPIVRTYISIPAGMARMPFFPFLVYSGIGALLWNTVLVSIGFFLGENWGQVSVFFGTHKNVITLASVGIIGILLYHLYQKRRA